MSRKRFPPPRERPLTSRWLDQGELAGYKFVYGLLRSLPRRGMLPAGAALGSLLCHLVGQRKGVAQYNLALAFPEKTEKEREEILLRSYRNLGRSAAEFFHLEKLTADSVDQYVRIDDLSAWRKMIEAARERGVVAVTAHFGNWELLAYAHGLLGHPCTLVYRAFRNPLLDDAIVDIRANAGTRSIAKKAAARNVVRALRNKELVAIPADQNQTRRVGVFVDFFGKTASTTPGPARLAMLTGAAVFPAFLVRDGESERHRIVILPELEMVNTGDRESDIVTNTQRCTSAIEQMVRQHPDHWIWSHKRWRTQPEGQPEPYKRFRR